MRQHMPLSLEKLLWTFASLADGYEMELFTDTAFLLQSHDGADSLTDGRDPHALREIAVRLRDLIPGFDYTQSVEFDAIVSGKSPAYVQGRIRYESSPDRRNMHVERMKKAISHCRDNPDEVYNLFPADRHELVREFLGKVNVVEQ